MEVSGFKFNFILEDGKCGVGPEATTAGKYLIETKKVRAIIAGCSGEVLQLAPITEQQSVLLIGVASGNPLIKNAGAKVYRTYPDLAQGAKLVADYADKHNLNKISIFTESNSFTVSVKKELESLINEKVILSEEFSPDETNYRTVILKAKILKPDAYYLGMASPTSYQNIVKQIRQLGIKEQLFAYYNPGEKSSLTNLKTSQNGIIYFDLPSVTNPTETYQNFLNKYHERFPTGPEQEFLLLTAYNAFKIITDMILNTNNDQGLFKSYLDNNSHETGQGKLPFDSNGDLEVTNFILKTIRGGKAVELTENTNQ
jgi:ABC-type branched-subunit amino acid transport system substrate-binding protein